MPASHPTTREIEIKLRIDDLAKAVSDLRCLGARPRGRVLERNAIYDTPDHDLYSRGRLLRLRVETPAPQFAEKRSILEGRGFIPAVRSLTSSWASAPEASNWTFSANCPAAKYSGGARRAILTSKAPPSHREAAASRRGRYKERLEREAPVRDVRLWPAIFFSLGFRPGFRYEKYRTSFRLHGLHLDLDETPVGMFLELEGSPAEIDRVARALGFSSRDYIRGTYGDLYAQYCRQHGRAPGNMVFHK